MVVCITAEFAQTHCNITALTGCKKFQEVTICRAVPPFPRIIRLCTS